MNNLLLAGIVFIAFIAALTIYLLLTGVMQIPSASAQPIQMNSLNIAEKSVSFLDSLRRNDNEYFFIKECADNSTFNGCITNDFYDNATNAWPVLAFANLYKATGNPAYLQKAQNDMQIVSRDCSINPDGCLWILVQMTEYQKVTGDTQYSSLISELGQRLLSTSVNSSTMILGIESRELALLYEMNGQKDYLDQAKSRLEQSKTLWSNNSADQFQALLYTENGVQFYGFACWTELAEIEIYQATKDATYLQNATSFFDAVNIDNHARGIDQLVALQPCIDSLIKLSAITGNSNYMDQAVNVSQYIVTYRWDPNITIAKKYNGDWGYLGESYGYSNDKDVTDGSYMIYLLSQMPNQQFYILRWN